MVQKILNQADLFLLSEYQDCFSLFDTNNDGKIEVQDLGTVVRSLGLNPTDRAVAQVAQGMLSMY